MRIRRIAVIVLTAVSCHLAGCATSPELSLSIGNCSREANAYTPLQRLGNSAYFSCLDREKLKRDEQKRIAGLQDRCQTYGFSEGTTPMAQCVMNLDAAFKTRDAQRAAEAAQGANCSRQMLLAFGAPTRTGSLAEATANGNRAYQECMGSQPPPQPASQRVCVPTMNPSPTGGTVMVCTN
jgi:hypothetical protein